MWYITRIMRISKTEKKSNEGVIEVAGCKKNLLKTIRKRQLQLFGRVKKADGLEKQILCGGICRTKTEEDNPQNTQTV